MCPFCIASSLWIATGALSTTGVSAVVAAKLLTAKTRKREEEQQHDHQ